MPRPRSAPDLYLLTKVSSLYYLRDQTQQEIADRLRISRPTVSRLLAEAQQQGIVQITIAPPRGLHTELESALEERYGLSEAQVVAVEPRLSRDLLTRQLGAAAAGYVARTVQRGETLGVAWGTTLGAMVDAMTRLPTEGVRVVQTLGGVGAPHAEAYAGSLVRRLAQLLDATPVLLPAPGMVPSVAVRDALRGDPHVNAALKLFDALDAVYVGIGALATNPALNDGTTLTAAASKELRRAGAVGDIAMRFFDADGAPVKTSLDDRILGVSREQLRRAGRVVAVAGGPEKLDAIAAGLATGLVNVLITDQGTAEALASRAK